MNPLRLLALLLALALLLGAGLQFFLAPSQAPAGVELSDGGPPLAEDTPSSELSAAGGADGLVSAEQTERSERASFTSRGASAARSLRLQLVLPAQAPPDPGLSVVVFSAGLLGGAEPDELLDRLRRDGDPEGAFARAPVSPSGLAELPVPDRLEAPRVLVDGRFLYLREPFALDVQSSELTLAPELGGALEVSLLAPANESPRGALRLMGGNFGGRGGRGGGFRTREQVLGADEVLEFRAVDPELTWTLMPALDEHHAEMRMGVQVVAGEAVQLDVNVTRGASVSGVVVDTSGDGLAGVEVSVGGGMAWMGGGDGRSSMSDANGDFALGGLPPGAVELELELAGWRDGKSEEMQLADGEERSGLRIVLDRGLSISGHVRWPDASAAPGAEIVVEQQTRQNFGGFGRTRTTRAGSATSDADGHFAISGLEEGRYTLRAELVDELSQTSSRAVLERVEAGGPEVTLALQGPLAFSGRVVDDLGEPVQAFELVVTSVEQGGPEERLVQEHPEGRFRFARVGPGVWSLRVEAEGYVHLDEVEHSLPDAGEELLLTVLRTARVEGIVIDPGGAPVAGASVRGGDGSEASGFAAFGQARGPRAESDAAGRFLLEDIAPGTFVLEARAEGWADSEPASFELVPGEARAELVLALRVGGRIEGLVLTPEGDPRAGRRVTWGDNAMGFGSRGETTSDALGQFAFEAVTPGEWTVSAVPALEEFGQGMRGGGQSGFMDVMGDMVTETVSLADGELVEVFLGGEPRAPVRVFGTVTRAGSALAGARVVAVSEGSAVFEGMKSAQTDDGGAYELVLDRPGPHTISASLDQIGVEAVIEVPRQDELRLDLAIPLGRIEGRVLEPDGSPASGLRLSLQREDGLGRVRWNGSQQTADAEGLYSFDDLAAGVYTVRANVAGFGGGTNERFGSDSVTGIVVVEDGLTSGVDFELESAGSVTGLVVGADGAPVSGASLYFRDTEGALVSNISSTLTDAAGRFEREGLAPGSYTVSARSADAAAGDDVSVQVVSGETADVRVVLDTGTILLVTLEDAEGQARSARVQVLDADGRDVAGLMTMQSMMSRFNEGVSTSEQRVGPIPPGRYTVRANMSDGRSAERSVRVRTRGGEQGVLLKLDD